jgi:hypothetical protein
MDDVRAPPDTARRSLPPLASIKGMPVSDQMELYLPLVQTRHLQVFEWVQGEIVRVTGYPNIDEARAAAERLAEERG